MKKIILSAILPFCFLISALLFPFQAHSAHVIAQAAPADSATSAVLPAPGSYACILSDSTFFYSTADGRRGVFLLPKTYYVRLVEYGMDYSKIEYLTDEGEYKKLTGYARTSELTFVDYVPKLPYLYYSFDVSYRIDDSELNDSSFLTEITVNTKITYNPTGGEHTENNVTLTNTISVKINENLDKAAEYEAPKSTTTGLSGLGLNNTKFYIR